MALVGDAKRVDAALRLLFWALIGQVGFRVIALAATQLLVGASAWELASRVQFHASSAVSFATLGLCALATLWLSRSAAGESRLRRVLLGAAGAYGLLALLVPFDAYQYATEAWRSPSTSAQQLVDLGRAALVVASPAVIAFSLARLGPSLGFRAPMGWVLALYALHGLTLAHQRYADFYMTLPSAQWPGPWLQYLAFAVGAAATVALAAFYAHCRARLSASHQAADSRRPRRADAAWERAASGLETYNTAMRVRLVLGILTVPLALAAGLAGNLEGVKTVAVLAGLGSLGTGLAVAYGLWRFSQLPPPADGGPATTALGLLLLGALFELWALVLALRLGDSLSAAFEAMAQAPWAEAGASVCGALCLISLLTALHSACVALAAEDLAQRCRSAGWTLGGAALLAVLLKLVATSSGAATAVLVLAVPVLVVALIGLVRFFSLLTDALAVLRAGPPADAQGDAAPKLAESGLSGS